MTRSALSWRLVLLAASLTAIVGLDGGPSPADAAMYQWTTPDGVIGLTDDPGRIPEPYRSTAKPYRSNHSAPLSQPEPAPRAAPGDRAADSSPPATSPAGRELLGEVDLNGHDRAWWQAQIRTLRQERAALQRQREDAEQKLNQLHYFGRETPEELEEQQMLQRHLDELGQKVAHIDQRLSADLPDEARKAGAPPGWLRD